MDHPNGGVHPTPVSITLCTISAAVDAALFDGGGLRGNEVIQAVEACMKVMTEEDGEAA